MIKEFVKENPSPFVIALFSGVMAVAIISESGFEYAEVYILIGLSGVALLASSWAYYIARKAHQKDKANT